MKVLGFQQSASQKIYTDYINRIKRTTTTLAKEDRQDVLMEFNSHIYEGMQRHSGDNEVDNLLNVIENLGAPEEVLKPLVAEKKLQQATKTFNPVHVFKALVLNITNGLAYIVFAFLYIMLFGFLFVIGAKIFNPDKVGLFFKEGAFFVLGSINSESRQTQGVEEVLGNWFIPVMSLVTIILYVLITLLLRLKRRGRT
ncbi:putative membrane protein [Gillisia sp. Hel_I_86]|uniref:HAAS signaling domain-containing protein n=1 Tax=Gillisia sp. Hel_I_86 TaxID=1249981 RepID=UPI00119C0C72|nr:DUF1700 domain-containing protein [Gillisia sp. Hel_I_86]TVZ25831.1 putative membrane protein [Gillisia sp. Hel_I_86]